MIGLMGSMTAMGWRRGRGEVDIGVSIGRALGMVLEYIGFTQATCMLGSGPTVKVMVVEFIHVRMVAGM